MTIEYKGFHPESDGWQPERIDPSEIDPKDFFARFIATRTPCILTSFPVSTKEWLDLDWIGKKNGEIIVTVEVSEEGQFGTAMKERVKMTFDEFKSKLPTTHYYLTTQYKPQEEEEEEGYSIQDGISPPLNKDIPTTCPLFGNLTPHLVNLWVGATGKENSKTCSGLHHDAHDNFYMLKQGRKQFILFSPRDVQSMYLNGQVKRVHSNGLIEYSNSSSCVRSDGAHMADVAEYHVRLAEEALEAAETQSQVEAAEEGLEKAMDELLEYQQEELISDDESVEAKRVKLNEEPQSFSQIDKQTVWDYSEKKKPSSKFPLLAKATPVTLNMESGECLFLPAGWFHQVTSFGNNNKSGIHLAVNYWLETPDTNVFDKPYSDWFWRDTRWSQIVR